jgi:hypothetical protein
MATEGETIAEPEPELEPEALQIVVAAAATATWTAVVGDDRVLPEPPPIIAGAAITGHIG